MLNQLECRICGGKMGNAKKRELNDHVTMLICPYCERNFIWTIPEADQEEEIIALYNKARACRIQEDFREAARTYEKILTLDSRQVEAYRGIALSHHGIIYEIDEEDYLYCPQISEKMGPGVNSSDFYTEDPAYLNAIARAGVVGASYLRQEGNTIAELQKKAMQDAATEKQQHEADRIAAAEKKRHEADRIAAAEKQQQEAGRIAAAAEQRQEAGSDAESEIISDEEDEEFEMIDLSIPEDSEEYYLGKSAEEAPEEEAPEEEIPEDETPEEVKEATEEEVPEEEIPGILEINRPYLSDYRKLPEQTQEINRQAKLSPELETLQSEGEPDLPLDQEDLKTIARYLHNAHLHLEISNYERAFRDYEELNRTYPDLFEGWYGMIYTQTRAWKDIRVDQQKLNSWYRSGCILATDEKQLAEFHEHFCEYKERVYAPILEAEEEKAHQRQEERTVEQGELELTIQEISDEMAMEKTKYAEVKVQLKEGIRQAENIRNILYQQLQRMKLIIKIGLAFFVLGIPIATKVKNIGMFMILVGVGLFTIGNFKISKEDYAEVMREQLGEQEEMKEKLRENKKMHEEYTTRQQSLLEEKENRLAEVIAELAELETYLAMTDAEKCVYHEMIKDGTFCQ